MSKQPTKKPAIKLPGAGIASSIYREGTMDHAVARDLLAKRINQAVRRAIKAAAEAGRAGK